MKRNLILKESEWAAELLPAQMRIRICLECWYYRKSHSYPFFKFECVRWIKYRDSSGCRLNEVIYNEPKIS